MSDALSLIREYTIAKKTIEKRDGLVYLGDFCWDLKSETNYMVYGTGREGSPKEYYSIETILFFLENVEQTHPIYIKAALQKFGAERKNYSILRPDRRDLLSYLSGNADSSSSIDKSAPTEMGRPRPRNETQSSETNTLENLDSNSGAEQSERLRNLLEKGAPLVISREHIEAVSDKLTSEKLASIKTKIRTRKRGTIADTDIIHGDIQRLSDNTSNNFERVWHTRHTILQSTGQDFKNVLNWLDMIKKKESGEITKPAATVPAKKIARTDEESYSRYKQEGLKSQASTGMFQIDTHGTNASKSFNSLVANKKSQPKKIDIPAAMPQVQSKKGRGRTPIIIVPASSMSIITLANVQKLLENFKFVPHEVAKKEGRLDSEVLIRYKQNERTISFKAINNVSKLSAEDWERVVAVFVQGPRWQFKNWPIMENDDPNTIFRKICAFHIKWENRPVEGNIRKWNCSVISLDENKRHLDIQKFKNLWKQLELYCRKDRPNLRIF